jgi:hypothetical protein
MKVVRIDLLGPNPTATLCRYVIVVVVIVDYFIQPVKYALLHPKRLEGVRAVITCCNPVEVALAPPS